MKKYFVILGALFGFIMLTYHYLYIFVSLGVSGELLDILAWVIGLALATEILVIYYIYLVLKGTKRK